MDPVAKVSVAMIAFNHGPFIVQAVESALNQTTEFEYEIVIGEDCSTDNTRELLRTLQQRAPERIRLILHDRNVGMHVNLAHVLSACRGRYVALLEGDDYWTDARKLQRQADVLDSSSAIAICHHNALKVDADGSVPPVAFHVGRLPRRASVARLLRGNFIVTCTAMFRNGLIAELPPWFYRVPLGDWALHLLNAQQGAIEYLDRVMAVYRQHSGGVWSTLPSLRVLEGSAETAELVRPALPAWQQRRLSRTIRRWRGDVTELMLAEGRVADARRYAEAHLSRPAGARLLHFYQGLDEERRGRRRAATAHLLKAAGQVRSRTRIGIGDIVLALGRVNCPGLYRNMRAWWRRWRSPAPGRHDRLL